MSIDLTKLTPAPWPDTGWVLKADLPNAKFENCDGAFIALARRAFDGDPEALAWWEANRNRREKPA